MEPLDVFPGYLQAGAPTPRAFPFTSVPFPILLPTFWTFPILYGPTLPPGPFFLSPPVLCPFLAPTPNPFPTPSLCFSWNTDLHTLGNHGNHRAW